MTSQLRIASLTPSQLVQRRDISLCVAGQGRCPPEDWGGVRGYAEFLQVIADPDHEEHESTTQWAGSFDAHVFDPAVVKSDDPKKRWKKAFERRP